MITMSTFSKLSVTAQYDDMCRLFTRMMQEGIKETEAKVTMMDSVQERLRIRETKHGQEIQSLKTEIITLQRETKKLSRQLAEARSALVRESDEKKNISRERRALLDQIKQVKQLLESSEGLAASDAQRKRVFKCLDTDLRLSPIISDDSDDGASGIDYDRTEEDLEPQNRSRRSTIIEDALNELNSNDQHTYLSRYLDKNANNDNLPTADELRRTTRGSVQTRASTRRSIEATSDAYVAASARAKLDNLALNTDSTSMDTDENDIDIELVRQKLHEAERKEKLATTTSIPNFMQNKAATLSARSTASLMKTRSNLNSPIQNANKPHSFTQKKSFKPDSCGPCSGKISFYGTVMKCEVCGIICHPECQDRCPLPCVKITAPSNKGRQKKTLISDYVNKDAVPKVPALIMHSCNEIEREDNIIAEGLYRVVAQTKDIEELMTKILKSKSGMPNLSRVDVHVLTGVVKRFLQSLDESLITTTLWSHFAEAIKLDSDVETRTHICFFIQSDLPSANRDTLAYLMQHLIAISKHSDLNKMPAQNLAKTLAPTIVGHSCRNPDHSTIKRENKIQIQIMEALFDIEEAFWSQFVHKSPTITNRGSLGSRLLGTPSASPAVHRTRGSRIGATLPTPKLKPLFSK